MLESLCINMFMIIMSCPKSSLGIITLSQKSKPGGPLDSIVKGSDDIHIQWRTLNFATFVGANLFIAPAEVAKFNVRHCKS